MRFTEENKYHNDSRYVDLWIKFVSNPCPFFIQLYHVTSVNQTSCIHDYVCTLSACIRQRAVMSLWISTDICEPRE